VSTDGRFVFVGTGDPFSLDPGELTTFAVRPNRTLEFSSSVRVGAGALGIGVAPNGRFVYLACGVSNVIMPFELGVDGRLTALQAASAPTLPVSAEISRDGKFLFVANHGNGGAGSKTGVRVFTIRNDGTLGPVTKDPTPAGDTPVWPALTPDGYHLYVTNEDDSGKVFGFGVSSGSLKELDDSPFDARGRFSMFQSVVVRG
jgi:6-phosphogluconolactonase